MCEKFGKYSNSIKCNHSLTKVLQICNYLNYVDSQFMKFSKKHDITTNDLLPFTTINSFKLYPLLRGRIYCHSDWNESWLALKPPKNLSHLFNEFNSVLSDINNTAENVIISKYYDINQLQTSLSFIWKPAHSQKA